MKKTRDDKRNNRMFLLENKLQSFYDEIKTLNESKTQNDFMQSLQQMSTEEKDLNSIGISKNIWKNYSIQIGNDAKNKHADIIFYMKNFSYPIIKIKYFNTRNKICIEIDNNKKKQIYQTLMKLIFGLRIIF